MGYGSTFLPECEICGITDEFVEPCNKYNEPHCLLCHLEMEEKGSPILPQQEGDQPMPEFNWHDNRKEESLIRPLAT